MQKYKILIHLDGGIGDIIMGTPCVNALVETGHKVDVFIHGDFYKPVELFRQWRGPAQISSIREDFEGEIYDYYFMGIRVSKPLKIISEKTIVLHAHYSNKLVHFGSKAEIMLQYAKAIDPGINPNTPSYCGYSDRIFPEISKDTVVLFPGCKKEYPMKRWDKFDELADQFNDVVVVGTQSDMWIENSIFYPEFISKFFNAHLMYEGKFSRTARLFGKKYNHRPRFSKHVKNYIGKLSLEDTAALINQAGTFIGNDGGLSYIATALKKPTHIIFGPTDPKCANIKGSPFQAIHKNLDCQPCHQGRGKYENSWKYNYVGCPIGMKCMQSLSVDDVMHSIKNLSI